MVDILVMVFKRFGSQLHTSSQINVSSPEKGTVVVGDGDINRALLFMAAVTAASELGVKVLFFTQSQIQNLPITLSTSIGLKPECLRKIRFVYPKMLEDLLEDVASLHELVSETAALPALIIVDGLEQYVSGHIAQDRPEREAQSAAAHLVALLHDTAAFLTQKLNAPAENQTQCSVIVSVQPDSKGHGGFDHLALDPLLSILERYLRVRCTSEKVRRDEGLNEWLLYLSGPELQVAGCNNAVEQLRWQVVLLPNGTLEFCPISPKKEETPQNPAGVNND